MSGTKNYSEVQCLRWIAKAVFKSGEADLIINEGADSKFAHAVIRQLNEDNDVQLKLDLIAEFSKDMLNIRVTRSSDILGRRSLTMTFQVSTEPYMPFAQEADLKKFWIAHVQKTQIDEMCKMRLVVTKSQKIIDFCEYFIQEQKK